MRVRTKHQSGPYDTRLRALEPRPDFVGRSVSAGVAAMMRRLAWYCPGGHCLVRHPAKCRAPGRCARDRRTFWRAGTTCAGMRARIRRCRISARCACLALASEAHLPFVRRRISSSPSYDPLHPLQKRAAKEIRSRGADASELYPTTTKIRVLGQNRGERSAERRIQPMSAQHQTDVAACRCPGADRRRRQVRAVCANLPASGRAGLPAHRCGSRRDFDIPAQLQAMLPGTWSRRALPVLSCPSPAKAPRPAVGLCQRRENDAQSRPGAVCETARRPRVPLRKQDRIRNAPRGERDSLDCH